MTSIVLKVFAVLGMVLGLLVITGFIGPWMIGQDSTFLFFLTPVVFITYIVFVVVVLIKMFRPLKEKVNG